MLRHRLYVVAVVLALSLFSGIAMLTPAANASSGTNTFMYAPDIGTSQLCLGIKSDGIANLRPCSYNGSQAWHRGSEWGTTSYYQYINANNQCLSVQDSSTAKGAYLTGYTCKGTSREDQYWHIDFLSTQTYECFVFNRKSGYVMVPSENALYATIVQEPWAGLYDTDQAWVFVINSNG